MNLKAHDCYSPHPHTTFRCYTTHASAQPLSDAGLVLLSPSQSFAVGLQGIWSSAEKKVCIRAAMILGGSGCCGFFFFLPSQPIRAPKEAHLPPAGSRAATCLTHHSSPLVGSSYEVLEMALNFTCSFTTLCCCALWGFTRTSDGKSGK